MKDRFEPLYKIEYDDFLFDEVKTIENKTFNELINFIDKQKLIIEKKSIIEKILLYSINSCDNKSINEQPFIVKEKVDFKKEKLPLKKL